MKVLRYPVIAITIFLSLGIIANYYLLPPATAVFAIFTTAFALLAIAWRTSYKSLSPKPYFAIAACLVSFSAGMMLHSLHYAPAYKNHYTRLPADGTPLIKGVVAERLKPNDYTEKYFFDITAFNKKAASGRILITVPKDSTNLQLHAGDVIIIADELQPLAAPLNPYQFDYAAYMANQNVFHRIRLKDNYIIAGRVKNPDYYRDHIRGTLTASFEMHGYSPQIMNIIKALLLGQRQDMDKETTTSFTDAGVVHILAISGLHIGILYYLLTVVFKPLQRLKNGRLVQLALILVLLWAFAFVSGLSASVVRSVLMFSLVGIGMYSNRITNIYNTIAVSMLAMLLIKPGFLFDVGFQLSYAAVVGIVWLHPLGKRIKRSKYKVVNYFTDLILVSLAAQIGVLPLSLYYFNQFPLLFLLANLAIIPLSTLVLVAGILVLSLNFTFPSLSLWAGKFLGFLIEIMHRVIRWIAGFDSLVIKNIPFTLALNLALYGVIVLFALWCYKKSYRRTMNVLAACLLFQGLFMVTSRQATGIEELIVFNNWGQSVITIKQEQEIKVYSTNSLAGTNLNIIAYNKGNFNQHLKALPLHNMLWFKGHKLFIIDSMGIYTTTAKPDVLLLTQSPKVNLDRLLRDMQPKQVVADATNYKSDVARWETTCRNKKIPFHATAEKGFYKISE